MSAFAALPALLRGRDDSFTACPPLSEQVLAPADSDGDGRFDRLEVLIPPYVAGPGPRAPIRSRCRSRPPI